MRHNNEYDRLDDAIAALLVKYASSYNLEELNLEAGLFFSLEKEDTLDLMVRFHESDPGTKIGEVTQSGKPVRYRATYTALKPGNTVSPTIH